MAPYRPGQFVWCRFPTAEQPMLPGPKLRIGYILAVRQVGRQTAAATLYTTTVSWRPGEPLPLGLISIGEQQARALDQRPFFIDARCAAALPVTMEFFPRLTHVNHGIQGVASVGLERKIKSVLTEMNRRQVAVDMRGLSRR